MKTSLVTLFLLVGCREALLPMEPLVIPPASAVEVIDVTRWQPDGERHTEHKIWDRQRIEAILAELRSHNTAYSSRMDRTTPQEYSIAINGRDAMEAMVWIGSGWLGGVDSSHKDKEGSRVSRYRKLDQDQYERLLLLLRQPRNQ